MANRNDGTEGELSSPACSMHEADDQYMGYAGKDELITFLNELLEAERAGAQVTLEGARAAGSAPISDLMRTVQQDEARWCGMLLGHIKALGEVPSPRVGAFYGKAMAIADLAERITFLNRGQGWVVRKLREVLPRVRNDCRSLPDAALARGQYCPREERCRPRVVIAAPPFPPPASLLSPVLPLPKTTHVNSIK